MPAGNSPKRYRDKTDQEVKAKSRVHEIRFHHIAQQRLRERLARGDHGFRIRSGCSQKTKHAPVTRAIDSKAPINDTEGSQSCESVKLRGS